MSRKIAVVGSRNFEDSSYLNSKLSMIFKDGDILVSGGAKGADTLAENFADEFGYEKIIIIPEWEKYGRKAAFIRNGEIVDRSDILIAFWKDKSKGTMDTINRAKSRKIPVKVYTIRESKTLSDFMKT